MFWNHYLGQKNTTSSLKNNKTIWEKFITCARTFTCCERRAWCFTSHPPGATARRSWGAQSLTWFLCDVHNHVPSRKSGSLSFTCHLQSDLRITRLRVAPVAFTSTLPTPIPACFAPVGGVEVCDKANSKAQSGEHFFATHVVARLRRIRAQV